MKNTVLHRAFAAVNDYDGRKRARLLLVTPRDYRNLRRLVRAVAGRQRQLFIGVRGSFMFRGLRVCRSLDSGDPIVL